MTREGICRMDAYGSSMPTDVTTSGKVGEYALNDAVRFVFPFPFSS